ncbi:hypothetical protein HPB52_014631 [Rhipicephalus sanguineus]|uniref:Uncharacterized protein n=1 Tax=Rhipicephalus sanguineus TaxID=34632 RepID=A0A9D4PWE3_RHISA|nr:hypothetical protein HPB52_014631 [Rhipicephalus sanguineus]
MDKEKFIALGRELGLEKDALREWVDKECALARDERAREREEAKESAERQRLLQEQELKILELKLKLQESAGRQPAEANEPGGATSSVTTSTTLHLAVPPLDPTVLMYLKAFHRSTALPANFQQPRLLNTLDVRGKPLSVTGTTFLDTQATRPLTPKPEHSSTGLKATCLRFAVPGIDS